MKVSQILSKGVFRLWKLVSPPLAERYQYFDTRMLKANEMSPDFPWKKYEKMKNPYFKKWGFDVSQMDAEYYGTVSGRKADYYVTRSMAVHYIYPFLDRYDFVPAYMDKNVQKALLHLSDQDVDVLTTEDVVCNSNGVFFDGEGNEVNEEQAIDLLIAYGKDTILKPTVETYGGHGVQKVNAGITKDEVKSLFKQYRYDFTFQKMAVQHPVMAQFNPTSVNTVRIVTYRKPDRSRKVLYSCVRFGGAGSVMDNVCSGGGFTGIDIKTGKLLDRRRCVYQQMEFPLIPDDMPNEIPSWDRIVDAALTLHGRLPQLDIIGWDFAVSPEGKPILIEFNPRPGVGLQIAVGPMFCKEDLDELMALVSKQTTDSAPLGVIKFKTKPERKTVHYKFGGM